MRLYDFLASGNGYKVRLLLTQTQTTFEWIDLDILKGETRTESFLAMNPNGRIPLLQLDDGRFLAESNAILFFLANGTDYLPKEPFDQAQVLQWMFFEQYSHEPYIAVSRFIHEFCEPGDPRFDELPILKPKGEAALKVMDTHLSGGDYFVGDRYSIADIALYAYTHVAEEGGFNLKPFPNVCRWLDRVAVQPRHIPITKSDF